MKNTNKLLCLIGLPASGKSTYAKELVAQGWNRVTKPFSFKDFEKLIKRKTRQMFINHLNGDVSVADSGVYDA